MANIGLCADAKVGRRRCLKRQRFGRCVAAKEGLKCGGEVRKPPENRGKKLRKQTPQEPVITPDTRFETESLERLGGRNSRERPWWQGNF